MTAADTLPILKPALWPLQPEALADLDISPSLVQDLVVRAVREQGESGFASLSARLKLPNMVLEPVFRQLRQQAYLDVKGMQGNDYRFGLTASGKAMAADRAAICAYAGPAPVSLAAYDRAVREQAAHVRVSRQSLREALSDLVLPTPLLDQLGPALISQKALFLYGPTGNGKTSLAERLLRVYQDGVLIPYAVELDGYIITLFDPVLHRPCAEQPEELDARWVLCHRPSVAVGGELVSEMLELRSDSSSGIYAAPLQMKANNGILVIDDFGRQVISPRDPFEVMVVFATNLDPSELADEAFLTAHPQ
ncbi:MAG TPA: hypothetical protein VKR61_02195 [Bryobacteraceae bacterium]|nr:hypothetical protein [Bryobacteraceae bacterium]